MIKQNIYIKLFFGKQKMVLNFSRNIVTLSYDDKEDRNFLKVARSLHRWRKTKNLYLILPELIFFLFSGIQHYRTSNFFIAKNDIKLNILFKNLI